MSRIENSTKNTLWGGISVGASLLVGMATRWIFVRMLGETYLGISGLYSDLLMLFSFAEMGFGSAITFSLYKPIAEQNREKIHQLLCFYRRAYRAIVIAIAAVGLLLLPFLQYLISGADALTLGQLRGYYCVFLVNSLLSYFGAYRESYLGACQAGYKVSQLRNAFLLITAVLQSVVLILTRSYWIYLAMMLICTLILRLGIFISIGRMCPEVRLHTYAPLEAEEKHIILVKVRALFVHKLANMSINQTDSLIVSSLVNVQSWGRISNYTLLRSTIYSTLALMESSVIPSMGNLLAIESKAVQKHTFYVYSALNNWLYNFCVCALITLSTPFIRLVFGNAFAVDTSTVWFLFLAMYVGGILAPVNILRTAGGHYENDKYLSILQAIVNLVGSIAFVKWMGLPGVFLGTILCNMVLLLARPTIVFRAQFDESAKDVYRGYIWATVQLLLACVLMSTIAIPLVNEQITIWRFAALTGLTAIVPNLVFFACSWPDANFREMIALVWHTLKQFSNRRKTSDRPKS